MSDDNSPTVPLGRIRNPDGMVAQLSYAVFTDEELLALDVIGADSAVKAIYATAVQGKWLRLDWRKLRFQSPVTAIRTALADRPPLFRWHLHITPTENDLQLLVYGWDEVMTAHTALIGALARWTVWPVLPAWGETLYELGVENDLIRKPAKVEGCLDYAFLLATQGWDEVIDTAVKRGRLALA